MKDEKFIVNIINQFIAPNKLDDDVSIVEQKGGLFNDVYRVNNHDDSYYIKQYLNQNMSSIFSPPTIDPKIRCRLAFEVQKRCYDLNIDIATVPDLFIDEESNTLVIEGVKSPIVLIDLISTNRIDLTHIESIAKTIARLHSNYHEKQEFTTDSIFLNKEFRDFKLALQYSNIAEELGGEYRNIIIDLLGKYKEQFTTVLHGDLNSRNIVVNIKNNTLGIIDFEQSHIGNPIYDIAYFLCEIYISCMYFKRDDLLENCIDVFFKTYLEHNKIFHLNQYVEELKLHLAIQIIYRFLGPSKNSWTFYIESEIEKNIIIDQAKEMLLTKDEKYIDHFFSKQLLA